MTRQGWHHLSPDGRTLTVAVPMHLRRHSGRKRVIAPDGEPMTPAAPPPPAPDTPLIRALARAFHWRRQLEDGTRRSLGAIARAERICSSYVTRTMRLTLLAPDIVQAILEGRVEKAGVLQRLEKGVPVAWEEQRKTVGLQS